MCVPRSSFLQRSILGTERKRATSSLSLYPALTLASYLVSTDSLSHFCSLVSCRVWSGLPPAAARPLLGLYTAFFPFRAGLRSFSLSLFLEFIHVQREWERNGLSPPHESSSSPFPSSSLSLQSYCSKKSPRTDRGS